MQHKLGPRWSDYRRCSLQRQVLRCVSNATFFSLRVGYPRRKSVHQSQNAHSVQLQAMPKDRDIRSLQYPAHKRHVRPYTPIPMPVQAIRSRSRSRHAAQVSSQQLAARSLINPCPASLAHPRSFAFPHHSPLIPSSGRNPQPRIPRPLNSQRIRRHIPGILRMTLTPLKLRLRATHPPLLDLVDERLDEVLVLDGLARAVDPAVSPPVDEPLRHALDRVL